ncbi:MAG: aldo/keto reductase [Candidatus Bathyarchaeota archaeon]
MKKVTLGRTGLKVSRVAMGGIPIQRPTLEEAKKVINRALDRGINLIDTSIAYGDSEIIIGKAIQGRRDQVLLATKGTWRDKATAQQHIDQSLKRLNTDHIDLWQFHNIRDPQALQAVTAPGGPLEAAHQAKEEGKILHLGFSTHNLETAIKGVESGLFETVQFPFNFIAREAAPELVPLARKHNVGFIGMKPFAGGNIQDARLALGYSLSHPGVVPDPGVEHLEEVDQIADLAEAGVILTKDDWAAMDALRDQLGNRFCRQCMYCMPCPHGVEIWLLTYMKNLFRLWPRDKVIKAFGKSAETATSCVQCGECEERCPYSLPIRELIQENHAYYKQIAEAEK